MAARILVVNDTQEILELFRMLLEGEGLEQLTKTYNDGLLFLTDRGRLTV